MVKTTLNFVDWKGPMFYATNVSKVTIRDLHLTRSSPGATQGTVTQVSQGQVVLEISPGMLIFYFSIIIGLVFFHNLNISALSLFRISNTK